MAFRRTVQDRNPLINTFLMSLKMLFGKENFADEYERNFPRTDVQAGKLQQLNSASKKLHELQSSFSSFDSKQNETSIN